MRPRIGRLKHAGMESLCASTRTREAAELDRLELDGQLARCALLEEHPAPPISAMHRRQRGVPGRTSAQADGVSPPSQAGQRAAGPEAEAGDTHGRVLPSARPRLGGGRREVRAVRVPAWGPAPRQRPHSMRGKEPPRSGDGNCRSPQSTMNSMSLRFLYESSEPFGAWWGVFRDHHRRLVEVVTIDLCISKTERGEEDGRE
jgi:hypothetical protein